MSKQLALVAFLATLFSLIPTAKGAEIFTLRSLMVDYRSFFQGGHDPLITDNGLPNRTLGKDLNLSLETDILKYGYWNSTVHSSTDRVIASDGTAGGGQFRMVGLEMGFGIDFRRITDHLPITFGYYHYSQHMLDGQYPYHFPVRDAVELKIYLYENKELK